MRNGKLHVGEWVEVRSKEEILKTLDRKGQLNGLPFMPQMFEFCGRRLRVYKRAHKTCDTVNDYKGRWMDSAVHLEGIRCDGQAYGGCQAACLIYWKEAWLKRAAEPYLPDSSSSKAPRELAPTSGITQEDVWAGTKAAFNENPNDPVYVCQATQVPAATQPLPWWDIRQYIEDWTSGNVGLSRMARGFLYMGFRRLASPRIRLDRPLRLLVRHLSALFGRSSLSAKDRQDPCRIKNSDDLSQSPAWRMGPGQELQGDSGHTGH